MQTKEQIGQITTCLVCHQKDFKTLYSDTLLQCKNCGFITANMQISEEELQKVYTVNYYKGEEYLDYETDKFSLQENFKKRLRYIKKLCRFHTIESCLEIGCAYGFFGEIVKKQEPEICYTGIDVVAEAVEHARNKLHLNAICGDYLQYKPQQKFSDVFMFDVIEHLKEPHLFLEKINREMQTGGKLYITTGDISALVPKIRKQKWRLIHPPSHLHYFSKKSIKKLLKNKGFQVLDISYPGIYRSIRQIYYNLLILNKKPPRIIKKIYHLIPKKMKLKINTFDIMFVIAEKEKNVNS